MFAEASVVIFCIYFELERYGTSLSYSTNLDSKKAPAFDVPCVAGDHWAGPFSEILKVAMVTVLYCTPFGDPRLRGFGIYS
jgi:hypothetical protein